MMLALLETAIVLTGEADLSEGRLGQPVSLALDFEHDVSPCLALALVTSRHATTNMRAAAGGGYCLYGNVGCNEEDANLGAEAHHAWRYGLRFTGGLHVFEDRDVGVKLAARLERAHGRFAVHAHPTVMVPDRAWLPVGVDFRPVAHLALGVQTGITAAFDAPGDWQLPLGGTLAFESRRITVGAAFTWHRLTGGADQPPNRAPVHGLTYRIVQLWVGASF